MAVNRFFASRIVPPVGRPVRSTMTPIPLRAPTGIPATRALTRHVPALMDQADA